MADFAPGGTWKTATNPADVPLSRLARWRQPARAWAATEVLLALVIAAGRLG